MARRVFAQVGGSDSLSLFYSALCAWSASAQAAWPANGSQLASAPRLWPSGVASWVCCAGSLAGILVIVPAWFLQYTAWGVAIRGPYLRLLIWAIVSVLIAYVMALRQWQTLDRASRWASC